jgi:hypothetical protein
MAKKVSTSFGDMVLYKMCAKEPKHTELDIIASKVWLIGRSYAAAIERGAGGKMRKGGDFYIERVAPAIRRSPIDKWIASVRHIKRLTSENIADSLRCHKKVMDLFTRIAGGRTKRSLASKYLHFHAPNAFFIYDSRANRQVRREIPSRQKPPGTFRPDCDKQYQVFCDRCLRYREKMEKELGKRVTPRQLDSKLLNFQF